MTQTASLLPHKEEILKRYANGEGTKRLGDAYGVSQGIMYNFIKKYVETKKRSGNYGKIDESKELIIQMYNSGSSVGEIVRATGFSEGAMLRKMKLWNLDTGRYSDNREDKVVDHLDEIIDLYYNQEWTYKQIAEKFNTGSNTICELFKREDLIARGPRKYSCDSNFFNKIDTEEKAYILGFIFADGTVSNIKRTLRIYSTDADILPKIAAVMRFTGPVNKYERDESRKDIYILNITDKKIVEDLNSYGCIPNKSLRLEFPKNGIINDNLMHHFIRGYFDGDGSISRNKLGYYQITFTGTEMFILNLQTKIQYMSSEFTKRYEDKEDSCGSICYAGAAAIGTIKFMYKNATIYMDRKYNKWHDYFELD